MYTSKKNTWMRKQRYGLKPMPGLQGQVDWAFFEDRLVYEDGKRKKLYCFLMILGYSRMRYAVHRIYNRHEHKYPHTLASECIPVLWRISGGSPVRQHETSCHKTLAQLPWTGSLRILRDSMDLSRFCADRTGGKQREKSKEQFILSVTILWPESNINPLDIQGANLFFQLITRRYEKDKILNLVKETLKSCANSTPQRIKPT